MKALVELILLLAKGLESYVEQRKKERAQTEADKIRLDPAGSWLDWSLPDRGLLDDKPKANADTPADNADRNI